MNYYEILEVSVNASSEVIKNAYRALSKKYHPDRFKGNKSFAEEKLKEINLAYETLIDENKRLLYDYDNGFKIDPNAIIVDENVTDEEEENQEKENKKDKTIWVIKKKNVLITFSIIIAFILAFFIGIKIANVSSARKEEKNVESTTTNDTYIKKNKDNNSNYNYNYNNTDTNTNAGNDIENNKNNTVENSVEKQKEESKESETEINTDKDDKAPEKIEDYGQS